MNAVSLKKAMRRVSAMMDLQKDALIALDQQNGDGDLGISMSEGFRAACACVESLDETDLGRLMMKASSAFNEAAPSSLGTILSIGMMGMAKSLKGKQEAGASEIAQAMEQGIANIMEKAKSKPGEKTVLDALSPAIKALQENAAHGLASALEHAAKAAEDGAESTRQMRSVHGRAAYYGEKSIGCIDGGAVAGKFIFQALAQHEEGK